MRHSPTAGFLLGFLLGLWLGGSLFLVAVVTWNFVALGPAFEANPTLAERAGFELDDDAGKRASTIWVYASELNRGVFRGWNRVQIVLGALTVLVLVVRCPRRLALGAGAGALALALVMGLWLEPQIVEIGRTLDFVPREPPPPQLAEFDTLHGAYSTVATVQVLLLLAAFVAVARGHGIGRSEEAASES